MNAKPKFCKDCKYYRKLKFADNDTKKLIAANNGAIIHQCIVTMSLIDGSSIVLNAERMRDRNSLDCGPDAKLFEPLD
jgi:hypothetical protein